MDSENLSPRMKIKSLIFDFCTFLITGLFTQSLVVTTTREASETLSQTLTTSLISATLCIVYLIFGHRFSLTTLGQKLFEPFRRVNLAPWYRTLWGWQLLLLVLVSIFGASYLSDVSISELFNRDGFSGARDLSIGLLSPDFSLIPIALVKIGETLSIAFLATALAFPIAAVISFFSSKNLADSTARFTVYLFLRTTLNFIRSIEPVIWAVIFAVWVGIGPFAGMLALFVQSLASLTKQFSESIESIQNGPVEGVLASGASRFQTAWLGVLPQVTMPFIAFALYRWDTNVRMATIIGMAGGGGIGTLLFQYSMRAQWPQVGCLVLVIGLVVAILDLVSAYVREALK